MLRADKPLRLLSVVDPNTDQLVVQSEDMQARAPITLCPTCSIVKHRPQPRQDAASGRSWADSMYAPKPGLDPCWYSGLMGDCNAELSRNCSTESRTWSHPVRTWSALDCGSLELAGAPKFGPSSEAAVQRLPSAAHDAVAWQAIGHRADPEERACRAEHEQRSAHLAAERADQAAVQAPGQCASSTSLLGILCFTRRRKPSSKAAPCTAAST